MEKEIHAKGSFFSTPGSEKSTVIRWRHVKTENQKEPPGFVPGGSGGENGTS